MSLISDALRKVDAQTAFPSTGPSGRSPWVYRAILAGSVALILVTLWAVSKPNRKAPIHPVRESIGSLKASPSHVPSKETFPLGRTILRQAEGELRLKGILHGGGGRPMALIGGHLLEEGQTFGGGKRLVRVEPTQVEIESEDGRIQTLRLAD
jgi:hypothetical protein